MAADPLHYVEVALRHLHQHDPHFAAMYETVGPFRLKVHRDRFRLLAESIIAQQISTRAAKAISARLRDRLRPRRLTAESVLSVPQTVLRDAGLSPQKCRYLRSLAEMVTSGQVDLRSLHRLSDEEIVERLTKVPGIGRWTAEMFLIFALGRPDVLPVDDFGLRQALQHREKLARLPDRALVRKLAQPWRPYATVGTWYCWQWLGKIRSQMA
jgi:DNA-3-methyladenine glycosylase II